MFLRVCVIVAAIGLVSAIQLSSNQFSSESDSLDPEDVFVKARHRRTSEHVQPVYTIVEPPVLKDVAPRYTERLLESLLRDYNDEVIPQNSTTVEFGLGYLCAQFDEQTRLLTSRVWLKMMWTDPRLTWKPESFGGITTIRIPFYRIWRPDIKMYNSLARAEVDYVNAVVSNSGQVFFIPPATFTSACLPSDIDNQSYNCTMKFGSWTYDGSQLPLETYELSFDVTDYLEECPYAVENATSMITAKTYPCCVEEYQDYTAYFTIVKRP